MMMALYVFAGIGVGTVLGFVMVSVAVLRSPRQEQTWEMEEDYLF